MSGLPKGLTISKTRQTTVCHLSHPHSTSIVHPIFSSFGFWYFGHFSCVIFFPFLFRLAHLALQNVNKDYVIFLYFRNFIAKSDQKPKTKNQKWNEKNIHSLICLAKIFQKRILKERVKKTTHLTTT